MGDLGTDEVQVASHDVVTVVTMTAASRRNALGRSMVAALSAAIAEASDGGCRALVLRAEPGARTWSAGFAIDELPVHPLAAWPHPMRPLTDAIAQAPMPVIAVVEGGAWGGACEVALSCDLIVAAHDATFALTPARLGVAYDAEAVHRLARRLPVQVLAELIMTAAPVGASRLHDLGVISRLAEPGEGLSASALGLAREIAVNAPLTISAAKAVLHGLDEAEVTERADRAWASADYREGRTAFIERRPPEFTGR